MAEIAFTVKKLKINNIEFISGLINPKISGLEALINSIFYNESNGYQFRKFGSNNTDWEQIYPKSSSRTVTSSENILRDDNLIFVDTSVGDIILTLPDPALKQIFNIKKTVSVNKTVINPFLSEKIDGSTSLQLKNINSSVTLSSDGTNWYII